MHVDARIYFNDIRRAVRRFYALEDLKHGAIRRNAQKRIKGGINGSPVERDVIREVHEVQEIKEAQQALWRFIDEGLEVLSAIRCVMGEKYAEAIYCAYFLCWPRKIAAAAHGVSVRAENYYLQIALEWVDSTPDAYIWEKRGIAE